MYIDLFLVVCQDPVIRLECKVHCCKCSGCDSLVSQCMPSLPVEKMKISIQIFGSFYNSWQA